MLEMWNARYSEEGYAYGVAPNQFFQRQISELTPRGSKLLLPAEGEGRNAVFAAQKGWEVTCFDISEAGKNKAMKLAEMHQVKIDYRVGTIDQMVFESNYFDAVGLIFAHFPVAVRAAYHQTFMQLLRPGGHLIFEAFSKQHLALSQEHPSSGGPKDEQMLFSVGEVRREFPLSEWILLEERDVVLSEGKYHNGPSSVIRGLAVKL